MIAAAASLAFVSMGAQLTPSPSQLLAIEERERAPKTERKRVNLGLADCQTKWKRSRGAQAKPKRHRNLVVHGRRVRRKHRRARKAA